MDTKRDDDTFSEQEAQRRFDAFVRAAAKTPPLHRKDLPPQQQESKRKTKNAAKPSSSIAPPPFDRPLAISARAPERVKSGEAQ